MPFNTEHLSRFTDSLEQAINLLSQTSSKDLVTYDIYRHAALKSFELSLETAGKLLRKALKAYQGNPRVTDALTFNDVLRHAGKHSLLSQTEVEHWLQYRENQNNTAHDYGESFANETLALLPSYLQDVRALILRLQKVFDAST